MFNLFNRASFTRLLAGNASPTGRDLLLISGFIGAANVAICLRLILVRCGVNKWVRSIGTMLVFMALLAGWSLFVLTGLS